MVDAAGKILPFRRVHEHRQAHGSHGSDGGAAAGRGSSDRRRGGRPGYLPTLRNQAGLGADGTGAASSPQRIDFERIPSARPCTSTRSWNGIRAESRFPHAQSRFRLNFTSWSNPKCRKVCSSQN